ncbi:porin [Pasteurellaceae bacterium LIM206]|nr:porin [Pasteurellaceae bacterium LIM206]
MKKTIIGLITATLAAGAANAAVVYQKDGSTIDIDGRVDVEMRGEKNKRTDLYDEGSRFRVRGFQKLGDSDFSALAAIEFRFSSGGQFANDVHAKRLFVGFTNPHIGSLTFGRQLTLGDHIPKANYTYEWGGNVFLDQHKKAAHFMSAAFGGVRLAADYYFGQADKNNGLSGGNSVWDEGQGYGVGFFYDGKWDDWAFRLGSGYTNVMQSDTGLSDNEYKLVRAGVGFDVTYKLLSFGVDWAYGKAENDHNSLNIGFQKIAGFSVPLNKNNRFQVGLKYDLTLQNALYGAYYFANAKQAGVDDDYKMRGWMLGVDHKFTKQVAVYLEGGTAKVTHTSMSDHKNHRMLLGARIMF